MGSISEMRRGFQPSAGDAVHTWDRENAEETANAERIFKDLQGKGFSFHTVDPKDQSKGAEVKTFHPSLGEVIAVPPRNGG